MEGDVLLELTGPDADQFYGVCAVSRGCRRCWPSVRAERAELEEWIRLCNRLGVSEVHLEDLLDDFLAR